MSALLAQATASFAFQGASVTLSCSSPEELIGALAKFGIASNDAKPAAPVPSTPSPTAAPQAQGNVPASTGTQASALAAGSGSAGGEQPAVDYKVVQAKVLALSKKSRDVAIATLAKFKGVNGQPVDHGNKLQLQDYAAFVQAADEALK